MTTDNIRRFPANRSKKNHLAVNLAIFAIFAAAMALCTNKIIHRAWPGFARQVSGFNNPTALMGGHQPDLH